MLKNIMIGLFAVLAIFIVIFTFVTNGKTLFLASPNKDLVYELRIKDGHLEHAVRHGGAQVLKWAPLMLAGKGVSIEEIKVEKADHVAHEYVVGGFSHGILLDVKIENTQITFSFLNVPAGEFSEEIHIIPEPNATLSRLTPKGAKEHYIGAVAPKAKGDCYIYYDILPSAPQIDSIGARISLKYSRRHTTTKPGSKLAPHIIRVFDDKNQFDTIEPFMNDSSERKK